MQTFPLVLFGISSIAGVIAAAIAVFGDSKRRRQIFIMLAFALLAFAGTQVAIEGTTAQYKHISRWVGYALTFLGIAYAFGRATCTRHSTSLLTGLLAALALALPAVCAAMNDFTVEVLLVTLGFVVFVVTMLYQWSRIIYDDMDGLPIVSLYWLLVTMVYVPWVVKWVILILSPIIQDYIGWNAAVLAYNIIDCVAVLFAIMVIAIFGLPDCFRGYGFYGWFVKVKVVAGYRAD